MLKSRWRENLRKNVLVITRVLFALAGAANLVGGHLLQAAINLGLAVACGLVVGKMKKNGAPEPPVT
jgi:hypothetical protein